MLYRRVRNKSIAGLFRPYIILVIGMLSFFPGLSVQAQVADNDSIQLQYPFSDEIRYPFSQSGINSPLILGNPSNIESKIMYDPETNQYIFSETIGRMNYRPPVSMSLDEYREYENKTSMSDFWILKSKESVASKKSPLLANFKLGETFDKIFGTDAINIVPQGSAELIFGYNISYTENPALSERNRSNGSFIFKEKIQMNVTGSIGDKMQIGINYNTEATFDFENKTKLEYAGKEDEIIKKIEAGNVSFNVPGTLISGSQSLFGLKADLQFGKLFVSMVASHQRGQSQVVEVKGGAQVNEFEVTADNYDANRHFFISHFFRDNYNDWMKFLPYVNSGVRIEQIEVWITNKTSEFDKDNRNILALMDLGEGYGPDNDTNYFGDAQFIQAQPYTNGAVSNDLNNLYATITEQYAAIRDFKDIAEVLKELEQSNNFYSGKDFEKIENARMLSDREYTLNRELGYISLNTSLRSDEVLAVAYVYTYRGKTYRVGELSTDGVSSPKTLVVKLLKGTSLTPKLGTWDLMMKNVYSLGAYQVSQQDFILDVLYRKDETGVPVNYIADNNADSAFNNKILLKVMNLDNLDSRNEPSPDGRFDFVEGVTIIAKDGRVFLPMLEPFGADLRKIITGGDLTKDKIADKYVFEELYDSTQTKARLIARKNKFFLAGTYQSSSSSEIQLNAMNVPRGSVKVTAGGIALVEGQDYTVDYTLGRVKILNQGYIESGTPIKISLENNALFNLQTKTLLGTHLEYKFSDNFVIGGTIMNLTERPLTQKVNMGDEPISNTIWGLNASYRTESRLLTTLVDKLPLIETKEISSISLDAEFAHLIPGQAKVIGKGGIAYVDDFEGTETTIELKSFPAWYLASTPRRIPGSELLNDLTYGYKRAKLAWYVIDPLFTRSTSQTPDNISTKETQRDPFVREVLETEIYKNRQSGTGFDNPLSILNLAYFPQERGPYNYNTMEMNPDGTLQNPQDKWGGIMREIQISDFENANVEYIEFWLMDPFVNDSLHRGGDLYFNLGEISEDILKDSWKMFENGLPPTDSITLVDTTVWGRVPTTQAIINAFDADPGHRARQDIGLDGLNTIEEQSFFEDTYLNPLRNRPIAYEKALTDPSNDDFKYFLDSYYDDADAGVIERYKRYNNLEGNSPTTEQSAGDFAAASTLPTTEDINRDNTLNENEAYFEYHVELRPNKLNFDNPYITDIIPGDGVNWYLFRIPITEYENKVGNIEDFKSIRFMRTYLTGFEDSVILRFAELHLVRAEWRKYQFDVAQGGPSTTGQFEGSMFDVAAVNIEENSSKYPVNYVLPPGIDRVIDPSQPQLTELNEQSILLKAHNLADGDARVVFKNTDLDFRQYKKLKMFVHAEAIPGENLNNLDVSAFIRIGSDQVDNYYEYEVPLMLTDHRADYTEATTDRLTVWPDSNNFEIVLDDLVAIKKERDRAEREDPFLYSKLKVYQKFKGMKKIKVKGTPNLGNIRTVVLGIRNPSRSDNPQPDDGMPKSVEVWFNELRLTDFNNRGGWAANARIQARLADLGTISMAGATSKPGFGSIEQKVDQRNQEETNQYDISTNIELGKLFPEKSKVTIPMFIGASNTTINPEYYPKEPDRLLKEVLDEAQSESERKWIKEVSQDYIRRNSINFTNIRVNKDYKKWRLFSPANFSLSAAYNESQARNYKVEKNNIIQYKLGLNYVYNARPKSIAPFSKSKSLKSPYLRFVKDFNFTPYPSRFTFRTNMNRDYNEIKLRNVYEDRLIKIDSTVTKDFIWNRYYDLAWDLTRSLKFDLSASNDSRIEEIAGAYDWFREGEHEEWANSVWQSIQNGGRPLTYNHSFNATYNVPINKFPILSWTSLSLRYNATFRWNQGAIFTDGRDLGNTISNSGTYQVNSQFNLSNLYSKIKYLKKLESKYSTTRKPQQAEKRFKTVEFQRDNFFVKAGTPKNVSHKLKTQDVEVKVTDRQGNEIKVDIEIVDENRIAITADSNYTGLTVLVEGKVEKGHNPFVYIAENSIRFLTGLKNVSVSYSNSGATMVMGYMADPWLFGYADPDSYSGAPGLPFLLGYQDNDIVREFAVNGWLTKDSTFSNPYTLTKNENINIRGTFEPFKGLRIELSALRTYSEYISEYFYYDGHSPYGGFDFGNRMKTGSFSISIISLGTAFEKMTDENSYASASFDKMKEYREVITNRLYGRRLNQNAVGYSGMLPQYVEANYQDGYGSTSPEVLVPAFLAAYTGKDPKKMSLDPFPGYFSMMPNWRLSLDGLTNFKVLKSWIKSANITHSYRSTYNINSFTTNFQFKSDDNGIGYIRDYQSNIIPELLFNAVSITEQFSPLAGVDITWINSLITRFEMKKSRTLALSLSNNQITESRNDEWIIGSGFRFKEVPLNIGQRAFESDLNLRIDLSIRDNKTVIRNLVQVTDLEGKPEATTGQRIFKINFTADYVLTPRFNVQLFFDRTVNRPYTSRSFMTADTNIGFSLRFALSQ
ncbi:MAG: cell surface protein SprA [Bacteroidales bacterium]|nr:cell surface protein SprA [Bacteroidales bacterium]